MELEIKPESVPEIKPDLISAEPDDNDNDLSAPYMQHTQALGDNATIEAVRRRKKAEAARQSKQAAPAPQVLPAPVPTDDGQSVWDKIDKAGGAPLKITVRPEDKTMVGRVASAVGRGAADFAGGFAESPTAIIGGVNDAVKNTARALDSLAEWSNANVAVLQFDIAA